jgi:hypothetical protein
LSTAIEITKWVKKFAVAQAKVTHILRPGKASEKTPKRVIPPSLCKILQNASRKKKSQDAGDPLAKGSLLPLCCREKCHITLQLLVARHQVLF